MSENQIKKYGRDFQVRVLYLLLNDRGFFSAIAPILKPDYFDNELISWSVNKIITYNKKNNVIITKSSLDVEFKDSDLSVSQSLFDQLMEDVEEAGTNKDLEYTKEKIISFCKDQNMKNTIFKVAGILKDSEEDIKYDNIYSEMKTALSAGTEVDYGYDYAAEVDRRYEEDARAPIATPWNVVNKLMDGGLAPGELGIIVCPPKVGKSWMLVSLATHAATLGLNVLHITLELRKEYVAQRFDANMTGVNSKELRNKRHLIKEEFKKRGIKNNIKIKKFNKPDIYIIEKYLDQVIESGFKPDIVLVDYADLIKGAKAELRMALKEVYEDLRDLSDVYDVPIWTASQSNRASMKAEVVTGDLLAEDFSKLMTADFILSLSTYDIFYVMANRFGDMNVPIEAGVIDKSIGYFEMLGVAEIEDEPNNQQKAKKFNYPSTDALDKIFQSNDVDSVAGSIDLSKDINKS
jgi:replicative DNA helicase